MKIASDLKELYNFNNSGALAIFPLSEVQVNQLEFCHLYSDKVDQAFLRSLSDELIKEFNRKLDNIDKEKKAMPATFNPSPSIPTIQSRPSAQPQQNAVSVSSAASLFTRTKPNLKQGAIFCSLEPMMLPALLAFSYSLDGGSSLKSMPLLIDVDEDLSLETLVSTKNQVSNKRINAADIKTEKLSKLYYGTSKSQYTKIVLEDVDSNIDALKSESTSVYAGVIDYDSIDYIKRLSAHSSLFICINGGTARSVQNSVELLKELGVRCKLIVNSYNISQCNIPVIEKASGCNVVAKFNAENALQLAYKSACPLWDTDNTEVRKNYENIKLAVLGGI